LSYTARAGDVAAVRALVDAGADVDAANAVYAAAHGGNLDVLTYLVEETGASLLGIACGRPTLHTAAHSGHLDIVKYVAKRTPMVVHRPDAFGWSAVMLASACGHTGIVRHLASLGCSLSREDDNGFTALDFATKNGQHDTARLLLEIELAGGWRQYVAACRMAYVRIRHEVSKTYAVLPESNKHRELLHLVFGRNRAVVADAAAPSQGERVEEAADDGSEKPKAMLELPDVVFRLVIRFLDP